MVSATALVADQFTGDMQGLMQSWVYGCRYMVWRSFYEKDYLKHMEEQEAETGGAGAAPVDGSNNASKVGESEKNQNKSVK